MILTEFPRILDNLENNQIIFQVLEMSLNFSKSWNVPEKCEKIHFEQKSLWIKFIQYLILCL